jgi:hypothetical protein
MAATDPEFAGMMVTLAEAYGVRLSPARIRLYSSLLRDIDPGALRRAFRQATQNERFFPTVADIRKYADGSADDEALLAWSSVERAVSHIGAYRGLFIGDPVTADALRDVFGTWPEFCDACNAGDRIAWTHARQSFLAAYRRYSRVGRIGSSGPVHFPGLCATTGVDSGVAGYILGARRPELSAAQGVDHVKRGGGSGSVPREGSIDSCG